MPKATKKPIVPTPTPCPYGGPGERALREAWEEGYDARRSDEPCPKGRKSNDGRHCKHWQEGDGDCCDCDRKNDAPGSEE